jgi:hypothetical protein
MDGPAVALPDSHGTGLGRHRDGNVTQRDIDGITHQMAGTGSATNGSICCGATVPADYRQRFSVHRPDFLKNSKQFCGR